MKNVTLVFFLLCSLMSLVFGQIEGEKVVARVNDEIVITLNELQAEIRTLPQDRLEIATTKDGVQQVLDQIIQRKLLAIQAKSLQMDTVAIVQKATQNSEESILADFLIIQVRQGTELVTEEQAREYYAANESVFYSAPSLELKQIIVATTDEANLVEKALDKSSFDEVIVEYPGIPNGARSGDLGVIPINQLSQGIYDQIKDVAEGKWAGPIQTNAGFHFIMVVAKNPSQKVEFENISKELQQQLTNSLAQQRAIGYIQSLVDEATITIDNATLKEAILTETPQGGN